MAHGRPAALGLPPAAPRDVEVGLITEPRGVAHGEQRAAEGPIASKSLQPPLGRAEPVLVDAGEPGARVGLGRGEFVELPQADRRRLLHQDAHPGPQAGQRLPVVRVRRRADAHQVGPGIAEQVVELAVGRRHPMFQGEGRQPVRVDVGRGGEHRARPQGRGVHPGDAPGPHDRYPDVAHLFEIFEAHSPRFDYTYATQVPVAALVGSAPDRSAGIPLRRRRQRPGRDRASRPPRRDPRRTPPRLIPAPSTLMTWKTHSLYVDLSGNSW